MGKYSSENTPREVMDLLAKNVRTIRKERKLTQKELSVKSGVAYATLVKFENSGIISLESFLKLCQALKRLNEFESVLIPHDLGSKEALFDV